MAKLLMAGRSYEIEPTVESYVASVAARRRCTVLATYKGFGDLHSTAIRAVQDAGGAFERDYNYETHLRVTCGECQRSLTPHGIGMLLMSQLGNVTFGVGGQRIDACPNCGHEKCYVLYDPDGFPLPKAEVAYYFTYRHLDKARRAFERARRALDEKGAGLDFHGVLELRSDNEAERLPFPHWLVIHCKDVTKPREVLGSFLETLALSLDELDPGDHDVRQRPASIEENRQRSTLHDSAVF